MSANSPLAEYRRRGWALVPIPAGKKGPVAPGWRTRHWTPDDFRPGANVGLILGPRSGETVDIDLDCGEALTLAPISIFLQTGAIFGRASKSRSHWLYVAPGAAFEAFPTRPGDTFLELAPAARRAASTKLCCRRRSQMASGASGTARRSPRPSSTPPRSAPHAPRSPSPASFGRHVSEAASERPGLTCRAAL